MMDLLLATSGGEAQAASGGYVDDVFSAYTYTGNGSTQTINNGIDLAGKGGLVWTKIRSVVNDHFLVDTVRGGTKWSATNRSDIGEGTTSPGLTFSSSGYDLPSNFNNAASQTFVSWTFRKAPKFFDVVTYTGTGATPQTINHNLGTVPGMIIVKATGGVGHWGVYHRSLGETKHIWLNSTNAETTSSGYWNNTAPTATQFTVATDNVPNYNGVAYVAYLFAHDPSAEGIIQCGSFTTDGSGNAALQSLGWEPQYVLYKPSSSADNWRIVDSSRGLTAKAAAGDPVLKPNLADAEQVNAGVINPQATGFSVVGSSPSQTYIYLAIRRPNKPPTSGTQVYNAIARTGTGAAATVTGVGFAPDLGIVKNRGDGSAYNWVSDRLRGASAVLYTNAHNAESTGEIWNYSSFDINGATLKSTNDTFSNATSNSYINHFFRRAKGVFDIVCDTGTGVAHGITHGLSVAPEFIIRKSRSGSTQWECWHSALAATEKLVLNSIAAKVTDATAWNSTLPTSTQFTVGTGANVNTNAATYVTYLFATLAGISKVGSYTGNGTSQTINCGFATGARFILVKRTDATGDWYVWDSVRGIIAANDPHLSLNTTAAEVTTDDSVDPEASGFIVNQNTTTNINVNGGQYIFLAIA